MASSDLMVIFFIENIRPCWVWVPDYAQKKTISNFNAARYDRRFSIPSVGARGVQCKKSAE